MLNVANDMKINRVSMQPTLLVTGGAGFIGSAYIRYVIEATDYKVVNIDKLTYAGNLDNLAAVSDSPQYVFERIDICDAEGLTRIFQQYQPTAVVHFAAESHVDRSIDSPDDFIETNIVGTYQLLKAARAHMQGLAKPDQKAFRFHHVSTDEVYGDLADDGGLFTEATPYDPSSPYSASKAASDHLVRAWHRTFGMPVLITNCSNNYGPYHFPEKLIPLVILNALQGKPLPIYGKGEQIRDWLYVEDHAAALLCVLQNGQIGETYNIGGHNEKQNIEVVTAICDLLEELLPSTDTAWADVRTSGFRQLITHVADRPGHDIRYAIDASKIQDKLGWSPSETFESGLRKTVLWYLNNLGWCDRVRSGEYQGQRLGLQGATL